MRVIFVPLLLSTAEPVDGPWSLVRGEGTCSAMLTAGTTRFALVAAGTAKPILVVEPAQWQPAAVPATLQVVWNRTYALPEKKAVIPVQPIGGDKSGFQVDPEALGQTASYEYRLVSFFVAGSQAPVAAIRRDAIGSGTAFVRQCQIERQQVAPGSGEPAVEAPKLISLPISDDDYPAIAARNGEVGVTQMVMMVSAAGKVSRCDVEVSSGSDALDRTSCALAVRRAVFVPAQDASGRPTQAESRKPFRWEIHDLNRPAPAAGAAGAPATNLR
ncbi:TonB family protein [Sphingomonas sp. 22176]|uniref:TonB family protein n=1 Tax=Sphingomonas sp. 22176 TaxID=3453884 RepID=UPI003F870680